MYRGFLIYSGLLLTLMIAKLYPRFDILPFLYMLLPLFFMSDEKLGFKNYKKGILYGIFFIPLFLIAPPQLSCPSWVLNQLGIAAAEEIFFRGYVMAFFGNIWTSVLFSLAHMVHFPTVNSILVFFPSLIFGFAYQRSGSILAPILLHFSANLFYFSLIEKFPQLYHLLQRQLTGS